MPGIICNRRDLKDGLVRDTENRHIVVYLDHTDVKTAFRKVEKGLDRGSIDWPNAELRYDTADDDEGLRVLARRFLRESRKAWDNLRNGENIQGTVALLKGLLIAADVVGSAVAEKQLSLSDWIKAALAARLKPIDLVPVVSKGTKGKPILPFQQSIGESKMSATLVAAGCGNGKTTGAYLGRKNMQWTRSCSSLTRRPAQLLPGMPGISPTNITCSPI